MISPIKSEMRYNWDYAYIRGCWGIGDRQRGPSATWLTSRAENNIRCAKSIPILRLGEHATSSDRTCDMSDPRYVLYFHFDKLNFANWKKTYIQSLNRVAEGKLTPSLASARVSLSILPRLVFLKVEMPKAIAYCSIATSRTAPEGRAINSQTWRAIGVTYEPRLSIQKSPVDRSDPMILSNNRDLATIWQARRCVPKKPAGIALIQGLKCTS